MPGEEVVNRQLSNKLNRFLNAFESGASMSPFSMASAGSRGGVNLAFNIGRPMSTLDALDLGRQSHRAALKYAEASI